jgi:DNA replication protein
MTMDALLLKKLIDAGVLDFDRLVLSTYQSLGLGEAEAMLLIALKKRLAHGHTRLDPKQLADAFKTPIEDIYRMLDKFMQTGLLVIDIVKNGDGKQTETFRLDPAAAKLMAEFEKALLLEQSRLDKQFATIEEAVVDLIETNFQKQLTPLEIEIIEKWVGEDHYDFLQIRAAVLDTLKANRTSLSYADSLLLKRSKAKEKKIAVKPSEQQPEALKSFFDSWPKE